MRVDGYVPIADYALIGDGRTAALVALDGSIDWLCLPNLDSPSVFAATLDASLGGASWDAGTPAWTDGAVAAQFEIGLGGRALLAMSTAYAEPLIIPTRADVWSRLAFTIRFWETWSGARTSTGPWADAVTRSA